MAVAKTARQVTGKRIVRQAHTKETIYPIVKKVTYYLGLQMNKQICSRAVGHAIPLLGRALSGVMTYAKFAPMARRPKGYLRVNPLARPSNASVINVESFDADLSDVESGLDEEIRELENS